MQTLTWNTALAALTLAFTPLMASAQGSTTDAAPRVRLPLEQYGPTLSVATPPGQLRRQEQTESVARRLFAGRIEEPRGDEAPPVPIATSRRECPMPVAVQDSSAVPTMPVMKVPVAPTTARQLNGCDNPLAVQKF